MQLPGFNSPEKVDRVDSGKSFVRAHSIEVGQSIVVFNNIGTIAIVDGSNDPWPVVLGIIIAVVGLVAFFAGVRVPGAILIIAGGGLVYWGWTRKPDIFLSIGTSDGKRTNIVSKNRAFLEQIRGLLRDKIDNNIFETATINISTETITGGVAIGDNAQAFGANSSATV